MPVPQFPFSAASGNFIMVPVSSIKAFLKVFFCSDFLVHCSMVIILLEPRLCQEGLSAVLCPPCLYPCWEVTGNNTVSSKWILSRGQTETSPPSFPQSALGHLIPSWPDQLLLCEALDRKDKLTFAFFEDPTALDVWKTTANKVCFCYLPQTELKCMTERIMPH